MTTGKTVTLTRRTVVGKIMSLLFTMLSRLVITFLPRSKSLLISWLLSPSAVTLELKKLVSHCFYCFPIYLPLECKSRKSRNTWDNRKIWLWNTEWSRAKTNRVLPRKCTGHNKHPLPTMQEMTLHMDITRWSTPKSDWLYSLQPKMEKLYTVSKNKTGSWLGLRSWTP